MFITNEHMGVLEGLAHLIGAPVPAVRLMTSILLGKKKKTCFPAHLRARALPLNYVTQDTLYLVIENCC